MENIETVEKVKTKKNGKTINIISNIFFIPVMVILIVYLVYAISVQKDNGVPSFFGQSYVRVLSGSMRKSGFEKGDVVVIEKVKISQIKAADENEKNGSIIAFYNTNKKSNDEESKALLSTEKTATTKDFKTGKTSEKVAILFHQVIGIYYDDAGNTWFETKGTSNSSADRSLIRGDYVIGQYKDSFMADVIQFISSTSGMIVLIIVPSAALLFLLLLNIIEIIDQMMREKKEKLALQGDIKERELEVTTIIEENSGEGETVKRHRRSRKTDTENTTETTINENSEEAIYQETSSRRRRRRAEETAETSTNTESVATEEPTETPIRRRRRVAEESTEAQPIEPAKETSEQKPVRRRRVVENVETTENVPTKTETTNEVSERRRRRRAASEENE